MAISGISSALFTPTAGQARRGQEQNANNRTDATASGAVGSLTAEKNLTNEQQSQLRALKRADAEVRTHEQAHKTAGGPFAGNIHLEFTTGPDGRRYATSGDVPIDASPVPGNPAATITKLDQVKRAALAPQNPSPEDRAVAARADAGKAQAEAELRRSSANGGITANAAQQAAARYQQAASITQTNSASVAVSA